MFRIIIYKDKITSTFWDEPSQGWIEFDIAKEDGQLTQYLNQPVEIQEDVTVEDFMKHLEKYEKVIDFCFAAYNHGNALRLYLDDMRAPLSNNYKKDTSVTEIELCWFGEIIEEESFSENSNLYKRKREENDGFEAPSKIEFISKPIFDAFHNFSFCIK